MSDLPDLSRFRELRPDLTFFSMQATAVYAHALKAMHEAGLPATEESLLAWVESMYPDPRVQRRKRPPSPRPVKRPRLISDRRGAVAEAIQTLARERTKLTWRNVATWMQGNVEGCESVSAKTLGNWRDEEGWPASADDPAWLR